MKKKVVVALAIALIVSITHSAFAQIVHRDAVNAHATDTYRVVFVGGQTARVAVSGDGDTDLDLYVYDENGIQVAADTDLTDECFVSWVPRWTGMFTIKIVNRGGVYNRYRLTSNGR